VTSSALASLNGLSVRRIESLPVVGFDVDESDVGAPGALPPEQAKATTASKAPAAETRDFGERMIGSPLRGSNFITQRYSLSKPYSEHRARIGEADKPRTAFQSFQLHF
jgi:hypothetical protein